MFATICSDLQYIRNAGKLDLASAFHQLVFTVTVHKNRSQGAPLLTAKVPFITVLKWLLIAEQDQPLSQTTFDIVKTPLLTVWHSELPFPTLDPESGFDTYLPMVPTQSPALLLDPRISL